MREIRRIGTVAAARRLTLARRNAVGVRFLLSSFSLVPFHSVGSMPRQWRKLKQQV
jgi:hypothetical protein